MFKQFINYSELKWSASSAAQSYAGGEKVSCTPDIENFILERIEHLPVTVDQDMPKIMLLGNKETNIFIYGPDSLINILITDLSDYIGKPWHEILQIKFEGISNKCDNFLISSRCHPWVINKFEIKELSPGRGLTYVTANDFLKADELCIKCSNFKKKA